MAGKKGMKSEKGWLVPRRYKGGYLDDLDGRNATIRGVRFVRACIHSDLGGYANLSRMEASLVDRAAFLIYVAEEMEMAVLSGKQININEYLSMTATLAALLAKLGLKRRAKQISLKDYLSSASPVPQPAPLTPELQHKKENDNGDEHR